MPLDNSITSVLIIGSGPIIIGQACEFDYAGSQAARQHGRKRFADVADELRVHVRPPRFQIWIHAGERTFHEN